jgi:Trk-type K+ transport system membrane component
MFEPHGAPLAPRRQFVRRMVRFMLVGAAIDLVIATIGAIGFRLTAAVPWLDAFLDAALVISGNGPRQVGDGSLAKTFLFFFALLGGTGYVVVVGLILSPAVHRLLHAFHLRGPDEG